VKTAQLELLGKPFPEVVAIFTPAEALILHKALILYVEQNKRLTGAKKLLAEFEDASIFF